jgi:hypothetical protein
LPCSPAPWQVIYTTVCADADNASDGSFAALQIHYNERFSAAGRTRCASGMLLAAGYLRHRTAHRCGGAKAWQFNFFAPINCAQSPASHLPPLAALILVPPAPPSTSAPRSGSYIKRDGRAKDAEVLTARLVDRPLRPMVADGWAHSTQLLMWVLSYDFQHAPEPLAITAAGAAMAVSDVPMKRVVAGARVGRLPGRGFVVNPTVEEMAGSSLDLVMAGTADAVLMIEGFCDFLSEAEMLEVRQALLSNQGRDFCGVHRRLPANRGVAVVVVVVCR